jgi:hypothetical protein
VKSIDMRNNIKIPALELIGRVKVESVMDQRCTET